MVLDVVTVFVVFDDIVVCDGGVFVVCDGGVFVVCDAEGVVVSCNVE